ncbi:TPA: hypothetical protein N0F65_000698, partial [Lagenidium giganteum]
VEGCQRPPVARFHESSIPFRSLEPQLDMREASAFIRRSRTNMTEGEAKGYRRSSTGGGESSSLLDSQSVSIEADSPVKPTPTLLEDVDAIVDLVLGQKLNLLMLVSPFALWSYYAEWSQTWIFILNFLVLIPLANLLGEATESLAFHTGETIGGLVNATFGNAVEVVVAIFALARGEIAVVQSSLIGSVLSNLLLVLGCSFIAGGLNCKENHFNAVGASANSSLLMLASFAMLLPSYLFYFADHESDEARMEKTLALSHIAAIFLLFMYLQLMFFQLRTHLDLFQEDGDEEEEVDLSKRASAVVLLVATLLVSLFSEFLVSSIDGFTIELGISKSFVGIILLPIVGNAVEHVTAVKVALNDKMELAMGVAVGSATQVSLFVVPVVVIAGWIMGQPMTLAFPQFEILIYITSIIIVYGIIADGKSNWLEGSMLLTAYALVAVALVWVHVPTATSMPPMPPPPSIGHGHPLRACAWSSPHHFAPPFHFDPPFQLKRMKMLTRHALVRAAALLLLVALLMAPHRARAQDDDDDDNDDEFDFFSTKVVVDEDESCTDGQCDAGESGSMIPSVVERGLVVPRPRVDDIRNASQSLVVISRGSDREHFRFATDQKRRMFPNDALGFVTPWNGHGYDMAKLFGYKFSYISPVWFQVREDRKSQRPVITGQHDIDAAWIRDVRRFAEEALVEASSEKKDGPAIVPRVVYERNRLSSEDIPVIIDELVTLADKHKFEGYVFEIPVVEGTIELLLRIGEALQRSKRLLIVVLTRSSNSGELPITHEVFKQLLPVVHRFAMNAYDVRLPGPNSPFPWLEETLAQLDDDEREKMLMGLPFYGYDNHGAPRHAECYHEYRKDGHRHVVYYPCLQFLADRLKLFQENNVGVVVWELGQGLDYFVDLL